MNNIKLCTYTRGFYPTVWGYRIFSIIGIYLVIQDGKIIKRSYTEMAYTKEEEHIGEIDALKAGLEWITERVGDPKTTSVQVFFCGTHREKCKKMFVNKEHAPITVDNLTEKFSSVSYYTTNKLTDVKLYDMANTIFDLLYGDSGFKHEVIIDVKDEGIIKKHLVGQPEIRWGTGMPKTMWVWS